MTDAGEKLAERVHMYINEAKPDYDLIDFVRAELERAAEIAEKDGNSCKQYGCGTIIAAAIRRRKE